MSLHDILDPVVRAYFENKSGGSGGGEGGNIAVDGGVFSFDGSCVFGHDESLFLKICDEIIPFDRFKELYVDMWHTARGYYPEEVVEAVPRTPVDLLDNWESERYGCKELTFGTPPGTGEYGGSLILVEADEVEYEFFKLTKGTYWRDAYCYPTRLVIAPAEP